MPFDRKSAPTSSPGSGLSAGGVWRQGPVRQAVFTSKGDQILSAGDDKTIKQWNVADGKEMKSLTNDSSIACLSVSADATRIATAGADKNVKIWSLADGKAGPAIPMPAAVQSLSLSPNGQRVAVALLDGALEVAIRHPRYRAWASRCAVSSPITPLR